MKKNDRYAQSLGPVFHSGVSAENTHLVLTSSSDIGVIRNFGRNGARYAPSAILNVTKKLGNHLPTSTSIGVVEVADYSLEKENFDAGQHHSQQTILQSLKQYQGKSVVHIGGGHDHISPLLQAIDQMGFEQVIVINVDAHCDTRVDDVAHSGTPFRDFAKIATTPWHLYQYGIHEFANNKATMSPLPQNNMTIQFLDQIFDTNVNTNFITQKITDKTALVFSLDVDALEASIFEGVSAVNHMGLSLGHVSQLMKCFFNLYPKAHHFFGIYEYNPVYDNLSQKGARGLSYLIHNFWRYLAS